MEAEMTLYEEANSKERTPRAIAGSIGRTVLFAGAALAVLAVWGIYSVWGFMANGDSGAHRADAFTLVLYFAPLAAFVAVPALGFLMPRERRPRWSALVVALVLLPTSLFAIAHHHDGISNATGNLWLVLIPAALIGVGVQSVRIASSRR